MKIYISIATYNEVENIEKLLRQIFSLGIQNLNVIVVDDNSPDKTAEKVEDLKSEFSNLFLIKRQGKGGYGSAHLAGFNKAISAGAEIVVSMDADLSHNPSDIPSLVGAINSGYDVAIGSRKVDGGKIEGWNYWRKFCSAGAMFISQLILGIKTRDLTSGFRAYKKEVLQQIDLHKIQSNGYAFLEELIYKIEKKNFKIKEVPITFVDRVHGKSKLSKKEIVKFFAMIFKLKFRK